MCYLEKLLTLLGGLLKTLGKLGQLLLVILLLLLENESSIVLELLL